MHVHTYREEGQEEEEDDEFEREPSHLVFMVHGIGEKMWASDAIQVSRVGDVFVYVCVCLCLFARVCVCIWIERNTTCNELTPCVFHMHAHPNFTGHAEPARVGGSAAGQRDAAAGPHDGVILFLLYTCC